MRRALAFGTITALATFLLAAANAAPAIAATSCTGVKSGSIPGSVEVPPGAACLLLSAKVGGSVLVDPTGALEAGGSTIGGSVTANQPHDVLLLSDTIGANVSITGLTVGGGCNFNPGSGIGSTTIHGNLTYSNSAPGSGFFEIGGGTCGGSDSANTIGGSVQVENNHGQVDFNGDGPGGGNKVGGGGRFNGNTGGGIINFNTFGGRLTCASNAPAFTASGNSSAGASTC